MTRLRCLVPGLALLGLAGCGAVPPAQETDLFARGELTAWEFVSLPATALAAAVAVDPDGVITLSGQPTGYLASTASYASYRLHFGWRWTGKAGNGGALLHIASVPKDRAWPLSIQVQTKHGSAGDVLPMAGASFAEPLSTPAGAPTPLKARSGTDSEKPAGQWNDCDIVSRAGTIEVRINGVLQNRISKAQPAAGRIGFQFEGTPYQLREVRLTPL